MIAYFAVASAKKTELALPPKEDCIRTEDMLKLTHRLLDLDSLKPHEIDEVCSSSKRNLIQLAANGQASEALQLARLFTVVKDKLQSPKVEMGILKAACIVAIYNQKMALELAAELTIPVRQIEARERIDQIAAAK